MARSASFEGALSFAADLIRIPGLPGREADVAARVRQEMEALGLADVRVDAAGSVVGVARGRGDAPAVMVSSHLDVVGEGEHADWEVPPFSGDVRDGCLHGRGAMDIKGPLAIQTYAAAALIDSAPGDVIVAHTVLEERGGLGMRHLLESGSVDPAAVVLGEATHGDICIGHRGRAEVEVVIQGISGHASVPDRARNALDLLGDVLAAVRDLALERADPVLGEESLVATMVDVLPETRNVIPDHVVVAVDWRVLPGSEGASLLARLRKQIHGRVGTPPEGLAYDLRLATERQRTYTGLEEDVELFSPGFLMEVEHPVVRAAARAAGRRLDGSGAASVRPWRFATDGGWTCGLHGIPTIGFAPGEERYAHTNRERLDVDEAHWAFQRYPEVITAIQSALAG
jgi:putative selenium metabolism hydrolase